MTSSSIKEVEYEGLSLKVDLSKVVSWTFTEQLSILQDDTMKPFQRLAAGVKACRYLFGKQIEGVVEHLGQDAPVDDVLSFLTGVLEKASKN